MGAITRTYVIRSGGYTKIGKTTEIERRIKEYNTHNPSYEILCIVEDDIEKELHGALSKYRVKNEWFDLPEDILSRLITVLSILDTHERIRLDDIPPRDRLTLGALIRSSSIIVIKNKWVLKLNLKEPFRISYVA